MKRLNILVACEESQVVTKAFTDLGFWTMSCDLHHPGALGLPHYKGDVRKVLYQGWDILIAHPPCTYLCVSGNRWFLPQYKDRYPDRETQRREAIAFAEELWAAPIPHICIENPVGVLTTQSKLGEPTQIIQPFEFGHVEPKRTCLWLRGLPPLRPTERKEPAYYKDGNGKNRPIWYDFTESRKDRSKIRSRTFVGIAHAMASQWAHYVLHEPKQQSLF